MLRKAFYRHNLDRMYEAARLWYPHVIKVTSDSIAQDFGLQATNQWCCDRLGPSGLTTSFLEQGYQELFILVDTAEWVCYWHNDREGIAVFAFKELKEATIFKLMWG